MEQRPPLCGCAPVLWSKLSCASLASRRSLPPFRDATGVRDPGIVSTGTSNKEAHMSVMVEIRAAEGGDDAKLLVREQLGIYKKRAEWRGL